MSNRKYTGPWNKQCPYCKSRKVQQDYRTCTEDGQRYTEWLDYAHCLACGKDWEATEVGVGGCPKCGVNYGCDITNDSGLRYRRQDGTVIEDTALLYCKECGCHYDQHTGEIIPEQSICWPEQDL